MSNKYSHVKKHRQMRKLNLVEAFGGKCVICGYNKSMWSLSFHHIDESKKSITLGCDGHKPIHLVIEEAQKCALVCANCHGEIHDGIISIDKIRCTFKRDVFEALAIHTIPLNDCPVCGNKKKVTYKTCSNRCSSKIRNTRIDWSNIEALWEQHKNYCKIGRILNCSDNAVKKKLHSLGEMASRSPD